MIPLRTLRICILNAVLKAVTLKGLLVVTSA